MIVFKLLNVFLVSGFLLGLEFLKCLKFQIALVVVPGSKGDNETASDNTGIPYVYLK